MGTNTAIEWTDTTWNPTRGCSRISPGCEHCYAERIAGRFSGPGKPYEGLVRGRTSDYHGGTGQARSGGQFRWTGKVVSAGEDTLWAPVGWKKPRRIFVNSMSDLFHEGLDDGEIEDVFSIMAVCPQHQFQVLTKRAERMRQWCTKMDGRDCGLSTSPDAAAIPLPLPNVWLGVSVEDQKRADERIPHLLMTAAAVRFLSIEPLLGPIDLRSIQWPERHKVDVLRGGSWDYLPSAGFVQHSDMKTLDWIIVGGESGPGARECKIEWIYEIVKQCREAGVPCFVKQLGSKPRNLPCDISTTDTLRDSKGGDPSEWPAELQVREWPVLDGRQWSETP